MNKKVTFTIIIIFILLAGSIVGVYLVQHKQLLQKDASITGGISSIRLIPSSNLSVPAKDTFDVDVIFDTAGIPVSGAQALLTYSYDPTLPQPPIIVTDIFPNSDLINNHQWRYTTSDYTSSQGTTTITIIAIDTSIDGYTSPTDTTLASIRFWAQSPGTINLSFNNAQTKVSSKATGKDILSIPADPAGTYSVGDKSSPNTTPSPTPSNYLAISPTPTPNDSSNSTNTSTITISNIKNGQTITDTTPTFIGQTTPNTTINATLNSANTITGTTTSDSSGDWSWTTPTPIGGGNHTATFSTADHSTTINFTVATVTGDTALPSSGNLTPTVAGVIIGILFILTGIVASAVTL